MKSLAHLIDDLVEVMQHTAKSVDVDAVHDLRVAIRRASAGLRMQKDDLPKANRLLKEIKTLRDLAAAVRDRDVIGQSLQRHRLRVSDPARIYLQGQRDLAATQLQEFLQKRLRKNRPGRWKRWIAQ